MKFLKGGWKGIIGVAVYIGFVIGFVVVLLLIGYYVVEFLYPGRLAVVGLGDRGRGRYGGVSTSSIPRIGPSVPAYQRR